MAQSTYSLERDMAKQLLDSDKRTHFKDVIWKQYQECKTTLTFKKGQIDLKNCVEMRYNGRLRRPGSEIKQNDIKIWLECIRALRSPQFYQQFKPILHNKKEKKKTQKKRDKENDEGSNLKMLSQ